MGAPVPLEGRALASAASCNVAALQSLHTHMKCLPAPSLCVDGAAKTKGTPHVGAPLQGSGPGCRLLVAASRGAASSWHGF